MNDQVLDFLSTETALQRLELLVVDIPQKEVFTSAIGKRKSRKALIVKWIDKEASGYGECSCRPDPFYSHEYVDGAIEVVSNFIFPLLKNASSYQEVLKALTRVRGWNFTKSSVEFAMNDAIRRKYGSGILEASLLPAVDKVPVGISLGMFDSASDLESKLDAIKDQSYQRLKFKISPDYNNDEILEVLRGLKHSNIAFDANGSYKEDSFWVLEKYASLDHIIEQPFPPGEFYLQQEYIKEYSSFKVCLDEEIESYGNLISLGLLTDEVNIKPGRVGGLLATLRMIDYCKMHGIKAWIGGMFETGIGRAQNLQIASLLPDAKAHDLSPSSRYFERDVVKNPVTMKEGFVKRSCFEDVEVDEAAIDEMLINKIVLE